MAKKISDTYLYNSALNYLSRYDASSGKVRDMLRRRLLRACQDGQEIPPEAEIWISHIIARLNELGYINDKRYAENQVRLLSEAGKSTRFISMKLAAAGLEANCIRDVLEHDEQDEMTRARRFVYRKKLGYLRPAAVRAAYYQKDLAALGRAGFSYETAVAALKQPDEDVF